MNETDVTVLGFVGTKPDLRTVGETVVAGFRVASTPRVFSARDNTWSDRETNWFTINAWRSLGQHCFESLHVGEPVIVRGRLRTQAWTDDDGNQHVVNSIDAVAVGHDLAKGTAAFLRKQAPGAAKTDEGDLARQNDVWSLPSGQVTSTGRFLPSDQPQVPDDAREVTGDPALVLTPDVGEAAVAEPPF